MTFLNFLYEKLMLLFLNLFFAVVLCLYLTVLGNSPSVLWPILFVWACVLAGIWAREFYLLKKKENLVHSQLEQLDQKYLICEVLDKPESFAERLFQDVLRVACKSMLEKVNRLKKAQREYKEYIEEWIHEVKTPITAVELILKNHPEVQGRRIERELFRIDYLVEQALYYARSENVEKDYFVKEFPLFDAVTPALMQNRSLILEEKIGLSVEESPVKVCTDEKWIAYIVSQILSNSIKYHRDENPWIKIYAERKEKGACLVIEDNGTGILPQDLPRIFEKGFTGSERRKRKSTGMGLYLCGKLCKKLGLEIFADSVFGQGCRITIGFPTGTYTRPELRN